MQRRLLVGRALMTNPNLAILDEPTSGLDVVNAQEIRNIVKKTAKAGTPASAATYLRVALSFENFWKAASSRTCL